jgi:choline dehydrogenase-like flavoprotein
MAVQINHDDAGMITGVVYADADGVMQEQKARAVAVAGNVIETTRLLLNSSSSRFPDGLGNSSDQLGRNYMRHVSTLMTAVMPGDVNYHKGTRQAGIILDEQYHRPERGFAGGYIIETSSSHPEGVAGDVGGWGQPVADYVENFSRLAGVFVSGEDPPQASNRISLHPTERDQYGLAVPVLDYQHHPNSTAMQNHAIAQTTALYEAIGGTDVIASRGVIPTCHNMGVARMSERPEDGVTNRFGQVHDIDNLFVSDGSVFTSSAAANPTLTIVALAIRQADHIAERMSRREL